VSVNTGWLPILGKLNLMQVGLYAVKTAYERLKNKSIFSSTNKKRTRSIGQK